jgi:hypothetical protein
MVHNKVFQKFQVDASKLLGEIIIPDDDLTPRIWNFPGTDDRSLRFELRDNSDLAKSLQTASVVVPWVVILPYGTEVMLSKQEKHLVDDFYASVEVKYEALPREEGKGSCGECLLFARDKGVELLQADTHTFAGGDKGQMNVAIIDAMAETFRRPTLTPDNVGYCPKQQMLCADVSPACDEVEPK